MCNFWTLCVKKKHIFAPKAYLVSQDTFPFKPAFKSQWFGLKLHEAFK